MHAENKTHQRGVWQYRGKEHHCHNAFTSTGSGRGAACGLWVDCEPAYELSGVNASAALWDPYNAEFQNAVTAAHHKARQECAHTANRSSIAPVRTTGAYCYAEPSSPVAIRGLDTYRQPDCYHYAADAVVVEQLAAMLNPAPGVYLSVNDFGAGVGHYGHALSALDSRMRWRGWDGAGNVVQWTRGFVGWFDLTLPTLSLRRADWVMCLEVAEHIPATHEAHVLRNLHAHNCRGVLLSWAVLGQNGHNHVNNHSPRYLIAKFEKLGYRYHNAMSARFRASAVRDAEVSKLGLQVLPWFRESVMAFVRPRPVC